MDAAGTLTQFNAIVAGLLGVFIGQAASPVGRAVMIAAICLRVIAAFILCFALRPTSANVSGRRLLKDTIFCYALGWRLTISSLLVAMAAAFWLGYELIKL